jgi:hypothetical protein
MAQLPAKEAGPVGSSLLNWSGLRIFITQRHCSNLPRT